MSVHDARDGIIIDVAVRFRDELDGSDGFFFGLVREHGSECAVADDADVRDFGAIFGVDDEAAAVVHFEADFFVA